jgi:hypothetical protein
MPDSQLSQVPLRQREQLARLLAPVGSVLLAGGLLLGWRAESIPGHLVGTVVGLIALLLLGVAWGLRRSAALDRRAEAEAELDAAILAVAGGDCSDCGGECGSCGVADCAVKALPRH